MAVETLRPSGDVLGHEYWTPSSGTDSYALCDEESLDTGDYISTATAYMYTLFEISDTDESSGATINSVAVKVVAAAAGGAQVITLAVGASEGAMYQSPNISVSSQNVYLATWAENPATSEAWTSTDIDDLLIGIYSRGISDTVYAYQMWVEVDYVAAGGTTLLPILLAMDHLSGGLMQ